MRLSPIFLSIFNAFTINDVVLSYQDLLAFLCSSQISEDDALKLFNGHARMNKVPIGLLRIYDKRIIRILLRVEGRIFCYRGSGDLSCLENLGLSRLSLL